MRSQRNVLGILLSLLLFLGVPFGSTWADEEETSFNWKEIPPLRIVVDQGKIPEFTDEERQALYEILDALSEDPLLVMAIIGAYSEAPWDGYKKDMSIALDGGVVYARGGAVTREVFEKLGILEILKKGEMPEDQIATRVVFVPLRSELIDERDGKPKPYVWFGLGRRDYIEDYVNGRIDEFARDELPTLIRDILDEEGGVNERITAVEDTLRLTKTIVDSLKNLVGDLEKEKKKAEAEGKVPLLACKVGATAQTLTGFNEHRTEEASSVVFIPAFDVGIRFDGDYDLDAIFQPSGSVFQNEDGEWQLAEVKLSARAWKQLRVSMGYLGYQSNVVENRAEGDIPFKEKIEAWFLGASYSFPIQKSVEVELGMDIFFSDKEYELARGENRSWTIESMDHTNARFRCSIYWVPGIYDGD